MGAQVAKHHTLQLFRRITFVVDDGANIVAVKNDLVAMLCYVSD